MLIYLDTCVFCRPFDELSSQRIIQESNAVAQILRRVDAGEFEVIGSTILLAEISLISSTIKQESVLLLVKEMANCTVIPTDEIKGLAIELMKECAIDAMDALHIAVAIENKVEFFLTTDDIILNKAKCISRYNINVKNPCEV